MMKILTTLFVSTLLSAGIGSVQANVCVCVEGGCDQTGCDGGAICVAGACNQDGLTSPICVAGRCSQRDTKDPICPGGFCDQYNSTRPVCLGGSCCIEGAVNPGFCLGCSPDDCADIDSNWQNYATGYVPDLPEYTNYAEQYAPQNNPYANGEYVQQHLADVQNQLDDNPYLRNNEYTANVAQWTKGYETYDYTQWTTTYDEECTTCMRGRCDQTGCPGFPGCVGGGCNQVGLNGPICTGGRCDQSGASNPICPGGGCCQDNPSIVSCTGLNCECLDDSNFINAALVCVCVEGGCDQTNCGSFATCVGGDCKQIGLDNPSCLGGNCDQTRSHNPTCLGGSCCQDTVTGSFPSCIGSGCNGPNSPCPAPDSTKDAGVPELTSDIEADVAAAESSASKKAGIMVASTLAAGIATVIV